MLGLSYAGKALSVDSELYPLWGQALQQSDPVEHILSSGWKLSCQRLPQPDGSFWVVGHAQHSVAQNGLLEQIIDFLPYPVFVKNQQHQWIHLNPAFADFVGHPVERLWNKSDPDFFAPEAAARYWRQDDVVFASGETHEEEDTFVDPEGTTHWIVVRKALFYDAHQAPVLVGVIIDITAYRNARQVLENALQRSEEAHRIKSNFLARMSHELRTPLHVMLGFSRLLQRNPGALGTEQGQDFIERIHRNGLSLLQLINDILDLAQLEDRKLSLRSEAFDVSILLEEVQQVYLPQAEAAGLALMLTAQEGVTVSSDRERLKQVLCHLVDNALKFTAQGAVTLGLEQTDSGAWCLSVSDTGPGISAEQAELIFQPFYQEDDSNRRLYGGAGVGLTLAQRLCLHLDCRLTLQSTLGQGSTFSVVFPTEGA
ncbi:MAG: sensor histidine kinase [Candidatus Sericytochromatia bacterium]